MSSETTKTETSPSHSGDGSLARLRVLTRLCRNRGGTCDCAGPCKAVEVAAARVFVLMGEQRKIQAECGKVENMLKRLSTPMATLREGFKFKEGLTPVVVFDGDEASFGYEDENGDWVEDGEWPFNESYVWSDDCVRAGIRVE